MKSFVQRYQTV